MEKKLILRGVLAGAVGGLLAFVFARIFAEPQIQKAIDYESGPGRGPGGAGQGRGAARSRPPHEDVFSRTVQANVGLGIGLVFFGMALGAMFAVAYMVCLGRVGNLRPRTLALLVAGAGFLGLYLVPFIKYPANPPSIGHPETINQRTALYLVMVVASLVFMGLAVWLGQRLRNRLGNWNATLVAAGAFIVAIGVVMAILPSLGHLGRQRRRLRRPRHRDPAAADRRQGHDRLPRVPGGRAVQLPLLLRRRAADLVVGDRAGLRADGEPAALPAAAPR